MILRVCPLENHAGGDTAQITDFAQTGQKCWFWLLNDYGKNLKYFILFMIKLGGPPPKMVVCY